MKVLLSKNTCTWIRITKHDNLVKWLVKKWYKETFDHRDQFHTTHRLIHWQPATCQQTNRMCYITWRRKLDATFCTSTRRFEQCSEQLRNEYVMTVSHWIRASDDSQSLDMCSTWWQSLDMCSTWWQSLDMCSTGWQSVIGYVQYVMTVTWYVQCVMTVSHWICAAHNDSHWICAVPDDSHWICAVFDDSQSLDMCSGVRPKHTQQYRQYFSLVLRLKKRNWKMRVASYWLKWYRLHHHEAKHSVLKYTNSLAIFPS